MIEGVHVGSRVLSSIYLLMRILRSAFSCSVFESLCDHTFVQCVCVPGRVSAWMGECVRACVRRIHL